LKHGIDVLMRTTLTLDSDVAAELQGLMKRRKLSLKKAVNEVMRRGLRDAGREPAPSIKHFQATTKAMGWRPELDYTNLNHLADQLEDEALMAKMKLLE
jgi:hypothetical protein